MSDPPTVILVRPQEQGNIGAAARAMANMGLDRLILVEPAVGIGEVARAFAVGAGDILDRAQRTPSLRQALAPFRTVIGMTSGRARRLAAPPLEAGQLSAALSQSAPRGDTALVFGPEASGLTNDELALCGMLVTIPAALRQPTLNLSQAVLIIAWELRRVGAAVSAASASAEPPAPTAEVEQLFEQITALLQRVGFARDDTFTGVLRDLRQLGARAAASSREVAILRGICRRIERRLEVEDLRPRPPR